MVIMEEKDEDWEISWKRMNICGKRTRFFQASISTLAFIADNGRVLPVVEERVGQGKVKMMKNIILRWWWGHFWGFWIVKDLFWGFWIDKLLFQLLKSGEVEVVERGEVGISLTGETRFFWNFYLSKLSPTRKPGDKATKTCLHQDYLPPGNLEASGTNEARLQFRLFGENGCCHQIPSEQILLIGAYPVSRTAQ